MYMPFIKYTQVTKWIDENLAPIHRKKIEEASAEEVYCVVSTVLDTIFNEHWNPKVIEALRMRLLRLNKEFKKKSNETSGRSKAKRKEQDNNKVPPLELDKNNNKVAPLDKNNNNKVAPLELASYKSRLKSPLDYTDNYIKRDFSYWYRNGKWTGVLSRP